MMTKGKAKPKTKARTTAADKMAANLDMEYLRGGKVPKKTPAGKILVHNHITGKITPNKEIGLDGFRAWYSTAPAGKQHAVCGCGWRPNLGVHYRLHRADDAEGTKH